MIQLAQGGAQDNIGVKDIKKYKMICPSIGEQEEIAKILNRADKEIDLLDVKIKIIKNQKKYLLNNLITGKIRIHEFQKVT
jgi:type I restriction enzyme S subunit